jgi:hypothetical protein
MNAAAPASPTSTHSTDDDAPNGQNAAALPPPGPGDVAAAIPAMAARLARRFIQTGRSRPRVRSSPDDPRYGRPRRARFIRTAAPDATGPVLRPTIRVTAVRRTAAVIYGTAARFRSSRLFGSRRQPQSPAPASSIRTTTARACARPARRRAPAPATGAVPQRSNPAPTAGRCSSPRCRRKSSRKSGPRSFRRTCAARK